MHTLVGRWLFFLITSLSLALGLTGPAAPPTPLSASVYLVSPSACPTGGCAAGQRLSLRGNYDLGAYDPALYPEANVQMCVYTPINWSVSNFLAETTGGVTGATYTPSFTYCATPPTGYVLAGGSLTSLGGSYFGDSLGFSLRINKTATQSGSVLMRVLENNGTSWTQTQQGFVAIPVIASAAQVFVANDASACGVNSPCYVNSGDDLLDGGGTALKDAVDAQNPVTSISILGNYFIKSNPVSIQPAQPLVVEGLNGASLSYQGPVCTNPMLTINGPVTLRNLVINDGNCVTTHRDLVEINSPVPVLLESNDLLNGRDAVHIQNNMGTVTLRFNHITGNSGYAVLREPGTGTGQVSLVANNLYGNRTGAQVECNLLGRADHNFWGAGVSAASAASQCTVTEGKRLGAPALHLTGTPGVSAQLVTVTDVKQSYFGGQVSVQRAADGENYDLYLVNHGFGTPETIPFTGGSLDDLTPCSNHYDIFLAEGGTAPVDTSLFFRYDLTSGCTATIESSLFCGQTDPAKYPLWWYDPAYSVTDGWDTTGQNPAGPGAGGATGQTTTCLMDSNEIQVLLDSTGRPNLTQDLNFTPFSVGLPSQPSAIILTSFTATPGNTQVLVEWETESEYNVSGFYVQRSLAEAGPFARVSSFIPHTGTPVAGAKYEYLDTGLTNNTPYYYRLEIIT
ncbi:MAG TPA: hypothetical protein PKV95_08320, partial [Anaerolineaceae bacterium]|nr:hypothetical protein [Anaerolineaceae bacterium]